VSISVAELAARVTFTRRKFRGFEVSPGRGAVTRGGLPVDIVMDIKAPIIDGTDEHQ
jgi:hypothetical protein